MTLVKTLLEQNDVNVDQPDATNGQTPLAWAAIAGHEEVIWMLLKRRDVNPNQIFTNTSGLTPLSWATLSGHEGILRTLLERNDLNADQLDAIYG